MYTKVKGLVVSNKEFFLNTLKSYFVTFINLIVLVFCTRYIVKTIGVDMYGLWILIQNVFGYLGILNFGYLTSFGTYFGRRVLQEKNSTKKNEYINTHIVLFACIGLVIVAVAVVLLSFPNLVVPKPSYANIFKKTAFLFLPGYVLFFLSQSFEAVLFYNFRMFNNRFFNEFIINSGQSLIFCVMIYLGSDSLTHLAILYSIITSFVCIKNWSYFKAKVAFTFSFTETDSTLVTRSFKKSISFWFMSISNVVLNQIDYLYISKILNSSPLIVLYSQTSRIPQFLLNIIIKFTNNKAPKIVDLYAKGQVQQIKPVINNLFKITLLSSVVASFMFILFGKFILNLWLGDLIKFDQVLITLFGLLLVPRSVQWIFWTYFNNINQPKYNLIAALCEIVINVALSLTLIWDYKLVGIVFASLVGILISNALLFYFFKSHRSH